MLHQSVSGTTVTTNTRILHVSDTRSGAGSAGEEDPLDGFGDVTRRARNLAVDAIIHTGNLVDDQAPNEQTLDRLEDELDAIYGDGIRLCYVEGRRDRAGNWNPWSDDRIGGHPAVEHLDQQPTDLGDDVAVFGLDYLPSDDFVDTIENSDDAFTPAAGVTHQLLALHQSVSPPIDREIATAQAFEIATSVNLYLDAIAGGGTLETKVWEHEDSGLGVYYPGTTNPHLFDTNVERPEAILYESLVDGTLRRRVVPIDPPSPTAELSALRELLSGYEQMDLENAKTETLIDLYGLLAETCSRLDDRRTEVRDVLLDRTRAGQTAIGELASVHHQRSTSHRLRDDDEVLEALERAGVDADRVVETVERVDDEAVEEVVEESPELSVDDVFEEQVREYIRKKDVALGGDSR